MPKKLGEKGRRRSQEEPRPQCRGKYQVTGDLAEGSDPTRCWDRGGRARLQMTEGAVQGGKGVQWGQLPC